MKRHEYVNPSPRDMDALLYAIEGALKVRRRSEFFLWAQGALQSLVPHETLLCAWGHVDGSRYRHEVFTRAILDDAVIGSLVDPVNGLLPQLVAEWQRGGLQPCVWAGEDERCPPALRRDLLRRGIDKVIAHGPGEMKGETGSFFVFLNGFPAPGARDAYFTELMMPHLHMALHRMADGESGGAAFAIAAGTEGTLTDREVQVLEWVRNGKTSHEIAQILDISPLTVKNHVQRILRKLNVSNRAQAVAKGIASRVVSARETA